VPSAPGQAIHASGNMSFNDFTFLHWLHGPPVVGQTEPDTIGLLPWAVCCICGLESFGERRESTQMTQPYRTEAVKNDGY
jgi:hypothetical protein